MEHETQGNGKKGILYVIACAAPPAAHLHEFVEVALAERWDVYVIATPDATKFINVPTLTQLTGHKVTSKYRSPKQRKVLPDPECVVVLPATFNTINKWAFGIADTLAVSILCEQLGRGTTIVAAPYLKDDLAKHPAFVENVKVLGNYGVRIINVSSQDSSAFRKQWPSLAKSLTGSHRSSS